MKFDKFPISEEILNNLSALGFHRTTDIQYQAIPPILNGEDVLAIAQTGTGKTAAFAIPTIQKIHELKTSKRSYGVKAVVLTPTRELAIQVGQVFAKLSKGTKANSFALYGGVDQDPQFAMLDSGVDILIATPGRLFDLISQGAVDLSHVSTLVIDEADQMLDLGFSEDIQSIKRKLRGRNHQTLFFSATINPKIKKLAYSHIKSEALRIRVSPEQIVSKNVSHFVTKVDIDDKRHLLTNILLENPEMKTIVFVRTQVRAERVQKHLLKNSIEVEMIHGGKEQEDRSDTIEKFSAKTSGVIVATDVTARGIDFVGVNLVVNYDLPENPENYVHRVGRTGRGRSYGEAISFCSKEELPKLKEIEDFLGKPLEIRAVGDQYLVEPDKTDLESLDVQDLLALEENRYKTKKERRGAKKHR